MKKSILLLFAIFLFSLNTFAQIPNFSGEWTLNKGKSKLDERQSASIESQTLKVEQSNQDVKVTVTTQQTENQNGRRADIGGGTNTYPLDGKEFNSEHESQIGKVLVKSKGEIKDNKLNLQSIRTISNSMGDITITTKEVWELSVDGKTLTVKREFDSQRGKINSELVFTKNS